MARTPTPNELSEMRTWIEAQLERGVRETRSAWHWPVLASVTVRGAPRTRSVVLRGFDAEAQQLVFTTDRRTAKVQHFAENSQSAIHIHDHDLRTQLRLTGEVALHRDGKLWQKHWDQAKSGPLADFGRHPAPGDETDGPDAFESDEDDAEGFFLVLAFHYSYADLLILGREGHRRAGIGFTGDSKTTWLVP